MKAMSEIISELEKCFNGINAEFYNNELVMPLITVQSGRKSVLGWCSSRERWNSSGEKVYEINIVAENLGRTKNEIVGTMMHECVHLYNSQHGIKDCTAAQYHNKKFKTAAESHGLTVQSMKNRGFAHTELNEQGKAFAERIQLNIDAFRLFNAGTENSYKKPVTYECSCGTRIRYHNGKLKAFCSICCKPFVPIS